MTKPSYEEPFVTLSYGGTFTAKNVEDALLGAKAELDKAESELARVREQLDADCGRCIHSANKQVAAEEETKRVRGLLQRIGTHDDFCPLHFGEECNCGLAAAGVDTGGPTHQHFFSITEAVGLYRCPCGQYAVPQLVTVGSQSDFQELDAALVKHGTVSAIPEHPNFLQSSSLVSQGAESADIGKLDSADKSDACNYSRFDEETGAMCSRGVRGCTGNHKSGVELGKVNRVEETDLFDDAGLEKIADALAVSCNRGDILHYLKCVREGARNAI